MNYYKIIVAYDGTDYQGWQVQADAPTIAGALQDSFACVFGKQITVFGASRTDAGVHALGQVAVFSTDLNIPSPQLLEAWSNRLPGAISIMSLGAVGEQYNPHHNVREKTYDYRFCLSRPLPFDARYVWHYRWPVDLAKLQEALSVFVGEHDFRSFCTGNDLKSTVRTIHRISVDVDDYGQYTLTFQAPGFLRYQIRRMVGAGLEVASRSHLRPTDIRKVLQACNPAHALPCAPACGLTLVRIDYGA